MKTLRSRIEVIKNALEQKKSDALKNLKNDVSLDYVDWEYELDDDITSYDELYSKIDDNGGFNVEIIYYQRAMEYLLENDNSLRYSLEIASDMGYKPADLNSEMLASLLASQNERENFADYESEFIDYFDAIENINNAIYDLDEIERRIDDLDDESDDYQDEYDDIDSDIDVISIEFDVVE